MSIEQFKRTKIDSVTADHLAELNKRKVALDLEINEVAGRIQELEDAGGDENAELLELNTKKVTLDNEMKEILNSEQRTKNAEKGPDYSLN